ncbi:MAG: DUF1707 domain-containing protein [Micromonosporaceae bacterium]|nr:DUF1707 domain-containing protein [Micromonosporaceae bacterium]
MSTQPENADPRRVRASDPEREEVVAMLRAAVAEGRLSLEEGDERMAKAYAAKYREELGPLTADLPDGGREALWRTPEALHAMRRRLRLHGVSVVAVAGALVALWILSGAHFFWPLIPLIILGLSLRRHFWMARHAGRWGGPWGGGPWGGGPWGRGPWGRGPWGPSR